MKLSTTLASTLAVLAALSLTACNRGGDQTAAGDSSTNPTAPSGTADQRGTPGAAGTDGTATGDATGGTTAPGTITPDTGGGTTGSADSGAAGGATGDATTERERTQSCVRRLPVQVIGPAFSGKPENEEQA